MRCVTNKNVYINDYMLIDCVLTSTDDNPLYAEFIPIFINTWKYLLPNVDVKIIFVGDVLPEEYLEYSNNIILFPTFNNINSQFVGRHISLLYAALLSYKNGVLITDIDILPLKANYYIDNVATIPSNKFINYRGGLYLTNYSLAHPTVWAEIFNIKTIDDVREKLLEYCCEQGSATIFFDQTKKWNNTTGNLIFLEDVRTSYNSLCDLQSKGWSRKLSEEVSRGVFTDFRAIGPYSQYRWINDSIIKSLDGPIINTYVEQYQLFNGESAIPIEIPRGEILIYCEQPRDAHVASPELLANITWKYDRGLRRPFINGEMIDAIKCSIDDLPDYIASASLIQDDQIIVGERFQSLADVCCLTTNKYAANPNNGKYIKKFINLDSAPVNLEGNVIYTSTDCFELFKHIYGNQMTDKILITHNADHPMLEVIAKKQLSQNCTFQDPRLIPLPIGIENAQWFDHSILHKVRHEKIEKTKGVYFFFSFETHPSRRMCYEALKGRLQWGERLTKEEYFRELKRHRYAICPRGNGLDCHRLWECLYLDTIPIIIRQDWPGIEGLPIVVLDRWEELNEDALPDRFTNLCLSKLSMDYYSKLCR